MGREAFDTNPNDVSSVSRTHVVEREPPQLSSDSIGMLPPFHYPYTK